MRFMHLGDLHFGKVVNGFSLIEDQEYILEQIKEYIKEYRPHALLLAGDIYDRSVPPAQAVALYSKFLKEILIQLQTPVLAVAGNHDGADLMSFGNELFEAANYYVAGNYSKEIKKVTLSDESGPVNFYLLPFADYAVVREAVEDKKIKSLEDAMNATLNLNELNKETRNVLITHAYVSGGDSLVETESEKKLVIGGKELVPVSLFNGFDYVALGHLHRSQPVKFSNVRYSGSLLKYSFSEEKDSKSMTMVDMNEVGEVEVKLLPLKPKHNLRTLKGNLEELLTLETEEDKEDYLRVILTDEGELLEPMAKLRQIYPNIMTLELERDLKEVFKNSDLQKKDRIKKSPVQLFADFYEHHRGEVLSEKGTKVIEDALRQLKNEKED